MHGIELITNFKHIYFWEWFHRLWGMTMGAVMLGGIVYFAWCAGYFSARLCCRKSSPGKWIAIFAALFPAGPGCKGRIGWFMVQSGLGGAAIGQPLSPGDAS